MATTDSLALEYEDSNPKKSQKKLQRRDWFGRQMRKQQVRAEARQQIRKALNDLSDPTFLDRVEKYERKDK